ncbi:hypothetical protein OHA25_38065 [Nonomuraea sp. NBC_00507]|uniref:hypothetical protein n=1 Tax=Nonomuraea sp. NBC_00507 TaxID=2976002 RepID=UPI002E195D29
MQILVTFLTLLIDLAQCKPYLPFQTRGRLRVLVNKLVSTARRERPPRRHLALATVLTVAASLLVAGVTTTAQADPEPTETATPSVTIFPRPQDPDAPLRTALEIAKRLNGPVPVEEV